MFVSVCFSFFKILLLLAPCTGSVPRQEAPLPYLGRNRRRYQRSSQSSRAIRSSHPEYVVDVLHSHKPGSKLPVLFQLYTGPSTGPAAAAAKKKSKKSAIAPMQRPIICICNDLQSPNIRALKQVCLPECSWHPFCNPAIFADFKSFGCCTDRLCTAVPRPQHPNAGESPGSHRSTQENQHGCVGRKADILFWLTHRSN